MEIGASCKTRGLKIPCGPTMGTRAPSRTKPFSSVARGRTSPWIRVWSSSQANAAARTRASDVRSKAISAPKPRLEVPPEQLYVWVITLTAWQLYGLAIEGIIGATILEICLEFLTHVKLAVRADRNVAHVEQPMDVTPKQEAVWNLVRPVLRVWPDMRCLKDGQRVFHGDRACAAIRFGHSQAKYPLS